jgi:D-psicose/D-tagatose/L-ribulose 3-epimerase
MKLTRRSAIGIMAGALAADQGWRFAICSSTFARRSFAEACRISKRLGYAGIEIEPAHLGPDPASLTPAERRRVRDIMVAEGLACPAFHSLLRVPAGLHLTTPDAVVRTRAWEYFRRIVDLAADIAPDAVLVLGSSKQREALPGVSPRDAVARLKDGLAELAPHAAARGVVVLLEPLAPHLCNIVNTLDEAATIVREIDSAGVQTILDSHNTAAEKQPLDELIRLHVRHIRHVHLNEMDGRRPGLGDFPFAAMLASLAKHGYRGWLSVEIFDFKPDEETVARQSLEYLHRVASSK